MSKPHDSNSIEPKPFDLRSQFVWLILMLLGLLVTIVGWLEWGT